MLRTTAPEPFPDPEHLSKAGLQWPCPHLRVPYMCAWTLPLTAAVVPEKEHGAQGPGYSPGFDSYSIPHWLHDVEHFTSLVYTWKQYLLRLWHLGDGVDGIILLAIKQNTRAGCYRS